MECVVLVTSPATQGARPHSKPPFTTTLFDGVGLQTELVIVVVERADEEVADKVREEAVVDTAVVLGADEDNGDVEEDALEETTVTDDESSAEDTAEED